MNRAFWINFSTPALQYDSKRQKQNAINIVVFCYLVLMNKTTTYLRNTSLQVLIFCCYISLILVRTKIWEKPISKMTKSFQWWTWSMGIELLAFVVAQALIQNSRKKLNLKTPPCDNKLQLSMACRPLHKCNVHDCFGRFNWFLRLFIRHDNCILFGV